MTQAQPHDVEAGAALAPALLPGGPLLEFDGVSKHFGGVRALRDIRFSIAPGEVHALLGHNGSGKSTLIKILAGFHAPDPGSSVRLRGRELQLPLRPGVFDTLGISFVHQHLGLIPDLTVLENLRLVRLATRNDVLINWAEERRRANALFARFGLRFDPDRIVAELSPLERALLAIVRAIDALGDATTPKPGLLVLDEPTPFLPQDEVDRLFELIDLARAEGTSIIFVSHDVDEVMRISDRATVLRDGRVAGSRVIADTTPEDLIGLIVGGGAAEKGPPAAARCAGERGPLAVAVKSLATRGLEPLSLEMHEGEILGLTGLMGSGFDRVPYALFGAVPAAGTVHLLPRGGSGGAVRLALDRLSPREAMTAGLALVPGDRLASGLVGEFSLSENIALPVLGRRYSDWMTSPSRTRRDAGPLLDRYGVRRPAGDPPVETLSGGNQQKVLLAKWFQMKPRLVLLDEPTQGVDVGARRQVFDLIRAIAAEGSVVLCASSDHDQLAQICGRVAVFHRGALSRILEGPEIHKDAISDACFANAPGRAGNGSV